MREAAALSFIVFFAIAVTDCSEPPAGSHSASASASSKAAPPKPFAGKLTGERIRGADGLVAPNDPWNDALAKLEAQMGKPTKLTDDGTRQWAVIEGDACTYIEIGRKADDKVGIVMRPMAVAKSGALRANYGECAAITGVAVGPPEDPNAPGPPTGGSALPLEMFMDVAVKARSRWKGERVKVLGQYSSVATSTMTSGNTKVESSSATIVVDKDKQKPILTCALRKGEATPDVRQYTPVVAEGVVVFHEMTSGAGDTSLEAALEDCTLDFFETDSAKPGGSARPDASAKPAGSAKPERH